MPNSGRCLLAYLCTGLDFANGDGDRQSRPVSRLGEGAGDSASYGFRAGHQLFALRLPDYAPSFRSTTYLALTDACRGCGQSRWTCSREHRCAGPNLRQEASYGKPGVRRSCCCRITGYIRERAGEARRVPAQRLTCRDEILSKGQRYGTHRLGARRLL